MSTRTLLRLIHGGGETVAGSGAVWLRGLPEPPQLPPQQLSFAFAALPKSTVVSLSLHGLEAAPFRSLLASGVRHVIDVRYLSAFRGVGFDNDRVFDWFRTFGIQYAGVAKLAPPVLGPRTTVIEWMQEYYERLEQQRELLRLVRNWIDQGPCVLVGTSRTHANSERDVLLRVLERERKGISVIVQERHAES